MAKEVFSFRFDEETIEQLDKLVEYYNEELELMRKKRPELFFSDSMKWSRADILTKLVKDQFKSLKESGDME